MDNGDATQGHAMTPEEFAKLMGAYPQPAENPLPTYGGYMDNSPANFSFVNMNDSFGAEADYEYECMNCGEDIEDKASALKMGYEMLCYPCQHEYTDEELEDALKSYDAETFEAPYAGAGSLFGIKQDTGLEGFTTSELTTSSAIHGDFDEASLNYSGHQNFEVRAEDEMTAMQISIGCPSGSTKDFTRIFDVKVRGSDLEYLTSELEDEVKGRVASWNKTYDAEMEMIDDSNARIKNRFGDEIGMVAVDDHEIEDAVVEVSDGSDMIQEVIISEAETKKSSMIPLALGAVAAIFAFPKVSEFLTKKELKEAETPELIENPNTGNLDPAQYEEMVVESTGYAVDVIPQVLDGSFMGSRFAALPTERYV